MMRSLFLLIALTGCVSTMPVEMQKIIAQRCVEQQLGSSILPAPEYKATDRICNMQGSCHYYRGGAIYGDIDNGYSLAHELTHYVQDMQGRARPPYSDEKRAALEAEARTMELKCGRM